MILFDIGSTLIDCTSGSPKGKLATALDIPRSRLPELGQLLFCFPAKTAPMLADAIAARFGNDRQQCLAAVERVWQAQIEDAFVLPGALELIARCRALGLPRAYLSNSWAPFRDCFAKYFPEESEQAQFFSFEHRLAKPDIAFFDVALKALATSAAQTIMVGDSYHADIAPAITLGMKTVWVLQRVTEEQAPLLKVVNRQAAAPSLAIPSIAAVTVQQLQTLLNDGVCS